MPPTFWPFSPRHATWTSHGSTPMLVLSGSRVDPDLNPVLFGVGAPGSSASASATLDPNLALGLYSLTATGRVIIVPHIGSNWGHPTVTSPSGGSALAGFDDALDLAVAMGLPDQAHLMGVSMGGLNCLRWAVTNQANFGAARLFVPVVDMQSMYDQAEYQTSLAGVWSGGGRAAFVAATDAMDPLTNAEDYQPIAHKITIFGATDDTEVSYTGLEGFCERSGIELTATTGGHLLWILSDEYDELDAIRLFDANEI